MNDTPETDMETNYCDAMPDMPWVDADFARKLERERNEAREDLEFRRGLYKVQEECLESERNTRNAIIAKGLELKKQLDEAREALRSVLELAEDIPDEALDAWKNYFHTILEAAK
jgi:hypothetical protein